MRQDCQKRRRIEYRQQKLKADEEYRQVCQDSSRKWRSRNPDYWKQYRAKHPDAVTQNREKQKARDSTTAPAAILQTTPQLWT